MKLSIEDLNILAVRHANSFEAAQLRRKLLAEGFHYCSKCKRVQRSERFPRSARALGGRSTVCSFCKYHCKKVKVGYAPTGVRYTENNARWRAAHPDQVREMARVNQARNYVAHPRTKMSAERKAERHAILKKATVEKRRAIGMSGSQANHMADTSEFYHEWNEIKWVRKAA